MCWETTSVWVLLLFLINKLVFEEVVGGQEFSLRTVCQVWSSCGSLGMIYLQLYFFPVLNKDNCCYLSCYISTLYGI